MNSSREDYLQAIYRLTIKEGSASNKSIAAYLNVSKPSVTEMLKKLDADGLVNNTRYTITLSEKGIAEAQYMLSKHRLWEYFLQEVLKLEGSIVHKQADLLEHGTTEEMFHALNAYLGFPLNSPKGNTIYTNHDDNTEL